jgi:hypothetical protein
MRSSAKRQLIADCQYRLWRGITDGIHTFNQCCRVDCENSARGGGVCVSCAETDLATVVGKEVAHKYVLAIRNIRKIESLLK